MVQIFESVDFKDVSVMTLLSKYLTFMKKRKSVMIN